MKQLVLSFFCSFLSSGYLQSIDNDSDFQSQSGMVPVVEEHIWPVHSYQTFRGNFYGEARRSINPKSCAKNSGLSDGNSQEKVFKSYEQAAKNQIIPTPTRRSPVSGTVKKSLTNIQPLYYPPQTIQEDRSQISRTQILNDEDSNTLRSQPKISEQENLNTFKSESINTEESDRYNIPPQVLKYEESRAINNRPQKLRNGDTNTLRTKSQTLRDEEYNSLNLQPNDLEKESLKSNDLQDNVSKSRIKTRIITKSEESNTIRTRPEILPDKNFNTFKSETKILQEEGTNNLRTNPHPSRGSSNTFRKQSQVLRNGESTAHSSSETTETSLSKGSSADEKVDDSLVKADDSLVKADDSLMKTDDSLLNVEEENINNSANHETSAPSFEINKVESFSFEVSTDSLVSPELSRKPEDQSEIQCADGNQENRRFEIGDNIDKRRNELPPLAGKKEVIGLNKPGNTGDTYILANGKLLRASNVNQVGKVITHNANAPLNTRTNVIDNKSKENTKTGIITNAKPVQRTGQVQFLVDPKTNAVKDPTSGQGVSYIKKTTLMLMDYDRICYACSSANSPACLAPDRRTGVKYCRKGDNACVTKSFGSGSTLTLIRDCAKSCEDPEAPGLTPNFKTCEICYGDLCNSAYSIKVQSLILTLPSLVMILLVKPL